MYKLPFPDAPGFGEVIDVAPGIKWCRLPLPFRLDHVNIYLIEDGDGWSILDTGLFDKATVGIWKSLVDGPLSGIKLKRIIVTHHHPDHIGMAGWLAEEHGLPLLTSQTAFLLCNNISLNPSAMRKRQYREFYLSHGMPLETAKLVGSFGNDYQSMVSPLPITFLRLMAGDTLEFGTRQFKVLTGDGHAPEQIMLYCHDEKILLSADQVIVKITPNISVLASEPNGDPLGHFMRSIREIKNRLPDDILVLPGHQLPFYGLHERCDELLEHHEERCHLVYKSCQEEPKSASDLVPVLFHRELDPHQLSFAFCETLAHINRVLRKTNLTKFKSKDGIVRYTAPADGE